METSLANNLRNNTEVVPPLSLDDLTNALNKKHRPTQFYSYSDLPDNPSELAFLLLSNPARFLFHSASSDGEVGHWTALRRNGRDLCWFSSYGFLPDGELMISPALRSMPGQESNKIAAALEVLRQRGYTIHYSSVPLQNTRVPTTSCGLWCLMFLTARINNFEEFEDRLSHISTPEKYAAAIYRREFSD